MATLKECDKCGVTAAARPDHPHHEHLPKGWCTVGFDVSAVQTFDVERIDDGVCTVGGAEHQVIVQSRFDLCPGCTASLVKGAALPVRMKPELHDGGLIVGRRGPPGWPWNGPPPPPPPRHGGKS